MTKSKIIPVRLDPAEWELIQRAAAVTGRTASAYLRHAATEAAVLEGHPHPARQLDRRRLREIASTRSLGPRAA